MSNLLTRSGTFDLTITKEQATALNYVATIPPPDKMKPSFKLLHNILNQSKKEIIRIQAKSLDKTICY